MTCLSMTETMNESSLHFRILLVKKNRESFFFCGRHKRQMASALDSRSSGLGSVQRHCVVFLGAHLTHTVPLSSQDHKGC